MSDCNLEQPKVLFLWVVVSGETKHYLENFHEWNKLIRIAVLAIQ